MNILTLISLAAATLLASGEESKMEAGCGRRPCNYVPRPGRRPCCPSSSDLPPLPPAPECPCCPPPPSDFWCPCDCPESSSTICPPPPIPVPPCPVVCCDSSSSCSSSSSDSSCHYRRVPVPRPFVRPRCKPVSSSSTECCVKPRKPRCRPAKPRGCGCGHKAADVDADEIVEEEQIEEAGEDVEEEIAVAIQNVNDEEDFLVLDASSIDELLAEAIEDVAAEKKGCPPAATCEKKKALKIVFQLDRRFVNLVNQQNLPGLYAMITDSARYAMITPNASSSGCSRVTGPLAQFLPNYIGYGLTSVFQDIVYNKDGSVIIHTLDVLTQGSTSIMAEDVWRTYKAATGCQYKIDYLNGVNWLCK